MDDSKAKRRRPQLALSSEDIRGQIACLPPDDVFDVSCLVGSPDVSQARSASEPRSALHQWITNPPSITRLWPWMYVASVVARNVTAAATSSSLPGRLAGTAQSL